MLFIVQGIVLVGAAVLLVALLQVTIAAGLRRLRGSAGTSRRGSGSPTRSRAARARG